MNQKGYWIDQRTCSVPLWERKDKNVSPESEKELNTIVDVTYNTQFHLFTFDIKHSLFLHDVLTTNQQQPTRQISNCHSQWRTKSTPMVEMNESVNELSVNLKSNEDLPTPKLKKWKLR